MNIWLLALVETVVILAVGYIFYGQLYKEALGSGSKKADSTGIVTSIIGMYVFSWAFAYLYRTIDPSSLVINSSSSAMAGLVFGLFIGLLMFGLPIFIDRVWLKNPAGVKAVSINWIVAFAVLGLIVGMLSY